MAVPAIPATFTKFPASLTGPFDDVELAGATVDWEVELVAVIGTRADRVRRGRRLVARRRRHRRTGRVRAHGAVRGRQPVLARQVVPRVRADGTVARDGRRARGSRRSRAGMLDRRRDRAGRAHERPDLQRAAPRRRAVGRASAAPRRRDLHRHPRRRRHDRSKPPRFLQPGETVESWIEGIGTIRNRFVAPQTLASGFPGRFPVPSVARRHSYDAECR